MFIWPESWYPIGHFFLFVVHQAELLARHYTEVISDSIQDMNFLN